MKKLLYWYDTYALKIGIAFLILFTALYPKLPSVHIIRTWVYIRLEDFFILGITILWFVQLFRGKVKIPLAQGIPFFLYWLAGLVSLIYSIIYIGPTIANFFPHVAALNYIRRIEYMILFFIALSTIKSIKDVRDYVIVLFLTVFGVVLYGLGQQFYLSLWAAFPAFFEKYSFCFPSFQTGNEEFAKGIPLCLPEGSRLTSTFGGHYDLAAYLALVLPILITVAISIKKVWKKISLTLLSIFGVSILVLTASRVSYLSYLIGIIFALTISKQKRYLIPVLLVSIAILLTFSQSTAKRLLDTVRVSSVVTNIQGELVGETTNSLPDSLKKKISENESAVKSPPPVQQLPKGSGFIGLPQETAPVATSVAVVSKTISPEEIRKLKLESGSIQISTVSGSFLIRKVLVYDISFTTRFQGEWPNALRAFLKNPILGSGYSTITLATDNDYLRALGETGLLGLTTFLFILLMAGITLKEIIPAVKQPLARGLVFGLTGGVVALLVNATLIDVFEASKVAENLWMLMGIGIGTLLLYSKKPVSYVTALKKIFSSSFMIAIYIFAATLAIFFGSINNFFVADDFVLLHHAAISSLNNVGGYFDKIIVFILYTLFSLQPQAYHLLSIVLHACAAFAVYLLAVKIIKNKLAAFISSLIFIFYPIQAGNIFWFSSFGATLATVFILYAILNFWNFRERKSILAYIATVILSILAFASHEISIIIPVLFLVLEFFIKQKTKSARLVLIHLPFIILTIIYLVVAYEFNGARNTAEEYLYLSSVGLNIAVGMVLYWISKIVARKNKIAAILLLIIPIITISMGYMDIKKEEASWQTASNFTRNTLSALRVDYKDLKSTDNLYFVAAPAKYKSASIFPTGLPESLWFIYQKNTPQVHQAKTVDEARQMIIKNNTNDNYIFVFLKNGDLERVK